MKPLEVVLPRGTMLSPGVSRGGDRGERRDQPGGDLGAVPGARGAGGGAVDDEQHHLGQRPAASTTRRSAAGRAPGCCRTGAGYRGTSGVHSHMTNSRLTDPEVLEWRFRWCWTSSGCGRGRAGRGVPRRRRGGAADPVPRADDGGDPFRASGGAAAGAGRRRPRGLRPHADRPRGRRRGGPGERRPARGGGRGRVSARDAGRRRLRPEGMTPRFGPVATARRGGARQVRGAALYCGKRVAIFIGIV